MPWEEGVVTLGEKSSQFTDIVQLVERLPHQKNVVGSNPAIGTKYSYYFIRIYSHVAQLNRAIYF